MSTDLTPYAASPFDGLRRTDDRGEHWSARDLMSHFDYARWTEVRDGIERASIAITNSLGISAAQANVEACLNNVRVGFGERAVDDFRLSRYGAYMWAMVSDPRKKAVAEAQTYFAVKTREAETAGQTALNTAPAQQFAVPQTMAEALRLAATAWEEKEQAQAALAVAEPKARAYDVVADPEDGFSVEQVAKMLTHDHEVRLSQPVLFKLLAEWRWIFRRHEKGRWVAYQSVVDRGWLRMVPAGYDHHLTGVRMTADDQVRVTGDGMAEILRRVTAPKQLALAVGGAA